MGPRHVWAQRYASETQRNYSCGWVFDLCSQSSLLSCSSSLPFFFLGSMPNPEEKSHRQSTITLGGFARFSSSQQLFIHVYQRNKLRLLLQNTSNVHQTYHHHQLLFCLRLPHDLKVFYLHRHRSYLIIIVMSTTVSPISHLFFIFPVREHNGLQTAI